MFVGVDAHIDLFGGILFIDNYWVFKILFCFALPIYIGCQGEKRYDVGIVPYGNCGILIAVNAMYFRFVIRCLMT